MGDDRNAARWLEAQYDGPDIAADCRVVNRRRDTGIAVAEFDHERISEATDHLAKLRQRSNTMSLFDFTRDVGISYDKIADARPIDDA